MPLEQISDDVGHDLNQIMAVVARLCGITVSDLTGADRSASYVRARLTAYAVARDCGYSLPEIGRAMGGRDHTTVLSGSRRFDAISATDPDLRQRHSVALVLLADAARGDRHAELRLQLIRRLMRARTDELACVARFLGVRDGE